MANCFFICPVKWDMIDCYYPWRFHIGECLQNGKFPFWNPYQDLGYPIHADPSSGAWYPFVWIIGYCFGYNIYTIGLELWIHVFIAAIGFYKLSGTLKLSQHTAFIAAVCYMLCGVFIGNAQHLTYSISACWMPFIINYYLRVGQEKTFANSIKAAFFLFLLVTGGYPAFTIILFYLLLIFFFYYVIKYVGGDKKELLNFFIRNILFFVLAILLSSGMLLSVYEVIPYISRISNFSVTQALVCPFSPQSSISFLLPFAVIKSMGFFDTDLSMSNAYFGVLMFLFFVLGIFIKKPFQYKILFGFALFGLFAAFGAYLPVREFLFNHIPLMNLFRFPSAFRLFTIIGFLLVGAYWFDNFIHHDFDKNRKKLMMVIMAMIIMFVIFILITRYIGYLGMMDFIKNDLFIFSKTSTIYQHVAFQSIVQSFILGLFLIVVWKVKEKNKFIKYITAIIVFELIFNAQLNAPYTVYYHDVSAKESYKYIKKFPSGFPQLPDMAIADENPNEVYFGPFWRNVNIFRKRIFSEGFNSFMLTGHEIFINETQTLQLYKEIMKNKIVFLSDKIYEEQEINKFTRDSTFTSKTLFFNKNDFEQLKTISLESNQGDTARLTYFAPDSFIVNTSTKKPQIITLLQNNYRGWEVLINETPVNIYTSNKSLISAVLPAGQNIVSFVYHNTGIKIAMWISVLTMFVSVLIVIIIDTFKKNIFISHNDAESVN
ncbi:MAG: hypothetical protein V1781_09055 [Bacteroidota bacterium]